MTDRRKRFRGTHRTTYVYSEPVYLDSHTIRLRPRPDPGQWVHTFEIDFDPTPAGITAGLDAWGNNVVWAWFSGLHDRLEITSSFDIERVRTNPYDFVVTNEAAGRIPPRYADEEYAGLEPFLKTSDPGEAVRHLAESTAEASGNNVLQFAQLLARKIQENCVMIVRPEGEPFSGEATLEQGRGSCRDYAVLYIEACRHMGIASRFVSGYVEERAEGEPRELHAWAGVYVPGGGWRGYDATQGVAVSTGHVTLAVAGQPAGAAPVTGRFSGDGKAELSSSISLEIEELGDDPLK